MPYTPSDIEIAWAAGLYEGEGCTWVSYRNTRSRIPTASFVAGLSITSTDLDVLTKFDSIISGRGRINGPKNPGNREGTRPVYQWTTQSLAEVQRVLRLFQPFMGERRSAKAAEILELRRG